MYNIHYLNKISDKGTAQWTQDYALGAELEQTLELSEIILALADDLVSKCPIHGGEPIETPEQRQWFLRYCEMEPAGITTKVDNN